MIKEGKILTFEEEAANRILSEGDLAITQILSAVNLVEKQLQNYQNKEREIITQLEALN